jgi:hypothetical protein
MKLINQLAYCNRRAEKYKRLHVYSLVLEVKSLVKHHVKV